MKIKFLDGTEKEFESLQEANLREANLLWANLRAANLQEADLQGANLQWAELRAANLRGTGVTVWHLFRYNWILTPTHLHAGCCRWTLEEAKVLTIKNIEEHCQLTEAEAQRAHKWLQFALEDAGND